MSQSLPGFSALMSPALQSCRIRSAVIGLPLLLASSASFAVVQVLSPILVDPKYIAGSEAVKLWILTAPIGLWKM